MSLKCLEKVGSAAAPATVAKPKPAAPAEPSSPKSPRSVNESPWSAGRDGGAVDGAAWDPLMDAGGDESEESKARRARAAEAERAAAARHESQSASERADEAFLGDDWRAAVDLYGAALKADPGAPRLYKRSVFFGVRRCPRRRSRRHTRPRAGAPTRI